MQRSLAYQDHLSGLLLALLFVAYEGLSGMYLFLPPLFGVLFYLYMVAMQRQSFLMLLYVTVLLLVFEAQQGYLIFSTLLYFTFVYRFIVPKLRQLVDCRNCLRLLYVLLAYVGFWLFSLLVSQVLWLDAPSIGWAVLWYIAVEFMVVTLL